MRETKRAERQKERFSKMRGMTACRSVWTRTSAGLRYVVSQCAGNSKHFYLLRAVAVETIDPETAGIRRVVIAASCSYSLKRNLMGLSYKWNAMPQ